MLREPGRPLDARERAYFEPRLRADLSRVRLHEGERPAASARSVNAAAYTVGEDVVMGGESLRRGSSGADRLLAHELAHTLQAPGTLRRQVPPASKQGSSQAASQVPEHDLAEAGLLALGQVLQSVAAPEAQTLRDMYNIGKTKIEAERARMLAQKLAESEIAQRLAKMRFDLAVEVRKTGSALLRQGAELVDAVRGQARPTYDSLRAAGKTDAQIIASATKTNEFVNALPKGMKVLGAGLWFVSAGLSIYVIVSAPPEKRAAVAQKEIEGTIGAVGGAAAGEALCIAVGIATEGLGLVVCGLLGGIAGAEGARHGLLEILDIAPHDDAGLSGTIFRIEGDWGEIDLFILSIPTKTVSAADNILVVATGKVSGQLVGGRGHYREYEVTPANDAAVKLFGGTSSRFVAQYLLQRATAADLTGKP